MQSCCVGRAWQLCAATGGRVAVARELVFRGKIPKDILCCNIHNDIMTHHLRVLQNNAYRIVGRSTKATQKWLKLC